jgi:hypothetical protein
MGKTLHKVCINSISVAMIASTVAFVLSDILPPASPNHTAQWVSEYYLSHTTRLRVGALFGLVGVIFYAPFAAAMAWEVKRMTRSDEAAYVQLILGGIATLALFSPWAFFATAAFRPERPPEILHALYDLAWLPLYLFSTVFALQFAFFAWAMRSERAAKPTFPRWFAHYTVFTGIAQAFGILVILEKTGPLAWNGVLAFWVPLVIFGVWTNLAVKYMTAGLKVDEPETEDAVAETRLGSRVEGLEAELAAFRAEVAGAPSAS